MTAADLPVESLMDWGDTVFGLPGDGINGIMEALRVRQDKVRFIQVRHERECRIHGLRLCKVHRAAWSVPGDLWPGRHSSAERTLRRKKAA